jgi:hypothetical protein
MSAFHVKQQREKHTLTKHQEEKFSKEERQIGSERMKWIED